MERAHTGKDRPGQAPLPPACSRFWPRLSALHKAIDKCLPCTVRLSQVQPRAWGAHWCTRYAPSAFFLTKTVKHSPYIHGKLFKLPPALIHKPLTQTPSAAVSMCHEPHHPSNPVLVAEVYPFARARQEKPGLPGLSKKHTGAPHIVIVDRPPHHIFSTNPQASTTACGRPVPSCPRYRRLHVCCSGLSSPEPAAPHQVRHTTSSPARSPL